MGGFASMTRRSSATVVKSGSAGSPVGGLLPALGGMPSATGLNITQATTLGISVAHACIMRRSKDVARCKPRLLKSGGSRNDKPVLDHPVAKLLRRPNWVQTWFEFALQMEGAFLLRHNAYAAILRDRRGQPIALIPINPDAVLVLEAADGSVFYQVNRIGLFQIAALRDMPLAIPAEDMFHLRGLALNMLVGVSTIGVARDALGVAMGLEQQSARFMANGARPSGVLKTPKQLTEIAANRLREQWDAFRSGIQNVGRTAILEEGLEWQQLQLTGVDLQFMEQRKFAVEDIARFWGVPLHKLGVPLPGNLRLSEADQNYVNDVVMPDLDMWEQRFAMTFASELNDGELEVDMDERRLLRAEESSRVETQRKKILSGISTQNEVRRENGDPEVPGGNELLRPLNLAASGSDMTGTAPDGAGRPADGDLPDPGAANVEAANRAVVLRGYDMAAQSVPLQAEILGASE